MSFTYKEQKFIDFVENICRLSEELAETRKEEMLKEFVRLDHGRREVKKEFINWFRKQIKK